MELEHLIFGETEITLTDKRLRLQKYESTGLSGEMPRFTFVEIDKEVMLGMDGKEACAYVFALSYEYEEVRARRIHRPTEWIGSVCPSCISYVILYEY